MRNFAEQNNLKLGAVAQPLRVALTGRTTSPGIFDVLAVLGREECLARLARSGGRLTSLHMGRCDHLAAHRAISYAFDVASLHPASLAAAAKWHHGRHGFS